MSDKPQRFIRNIMGDIYDRETDKWFEEDWKGKPLDYDDDLIVFLNEQDKQIKELIDLIIDKVQYYEDHLEEFLIKKGIIDKDWARFDDYD